MVRDVTPEELQTIIANTDLVFVDCWAPWCGPCRALSPILEEIEKRYANDSRIVFLKLNTDDHLDFTRSFGITAIPCVLVFHKGKPAKFKLYNKISGRKTVSDRIIGLQDATVYENVIQQFLS